MAEFGDFDILTFMANIWWDWDLGSGFAPYIGGGAGLAIVDANDVGYAGTPDTPVFDSSELGFAFQAGAGFRWMAWETVGFDIGYRFRGYDGQSFDAVLPNSGDFDADFFFTHNIIAGLTFNF